MFLRLLRDLCPHFVAREFLEHTPSVQVDPPSALSACVMCLSLHRLCLVLAQVDLTVAVQAIHKELCSQLSGANFAALLVTRMRGRGRNCGSNGGSNGNGASGSVLVLVVVIIDNSRCRRAHLACASIVGSAWLATKENAQVRPVNALSFPAETDTRTKNTFAATPVIGSSRRGR